MESPESRNRYLQRQVEQIRDLSESRVVDVVVKIRSPKDNSDAFLSTVADALRRRSMTSSSRDLLPADERLVESGAADQVQASGLTEQVLRGESAVMSAVKRNHSAAVRDFIGSNEVQESLAATSGVPTADKPEHVDPIAFWSSSSVVMQLRGEDLDRLIENAEIEGIYLNQRIMTPPVSSPRSLSAEVLDNKVSSWGLRTIGALSTWGAFGCRGKGITIGLLDTGVDADHPDLRGKISKWAEFDAQGRTVVGSTPHDTATHGTHCAGTIVGGNAGGCWIGVAPEARIAAGLVLNGDRGGTQAQILAGMEWAISQRVDVISMSLGGLLLTPEVPSTYTEAMLTAVRAGIPVVTAIGNEGSQTTGAPGNDFLAFAVGATDIQNRAAGFSGGRTQIIRQSPYFPADALPLVYSKPEVVAPGVAVYSCIPGGGYEHYNGTSMAAPHVAGAIALLLSGTDIRKNVPAAKRAFLLQDLLTGSAQELGESGQNHRFGFGRIDVLAAIGYAKSLGY